MSRKKLSGLGVAAVLVLLLFFVISKSRSDEGKSKGAAAEPSTTRLSAAERPALQQQDGSAVAGEVPEGSVAVRRVLFDELREAVGQTPSAMELTALDDFRVPNVEELRDPQLQALYSIDREIHRRRVFSRHEKLETRRFLRDAERERDDQKRAVLERSARLHEVMAWNYRKQVGELMNRRAALATEIYARGNSPAVVADQAELPTQKEDLR